MSQKDGKSIGISTAMFTGTKSKRENPNITYFTLPKESTCFSGQVIDSDFNVAIDCQTNDGNEDLVCYANILKSTITCTSVDSLNQVHTRKSETLTIGGEQFLLTATYSRDAKSTDLTYLTIYHIDEDYIDFVNIIDGYQLGLGSDILISDFDITLDGMIVVNDLRKNQLHFVQYSLPNTITKVSTFTADHPVFEFEITEMNIILISSGVYVIEYKLSSMTVMAKY